MLEFLLDMLEMSRWESESFDNLGNEIMLQLSNQVDPIDPEQLKLLGHDTKEKRDERMMKLKIGMKAATSSINYGDYPWNPVSPCPEIPTYVLRYRASGASISCLPSTVHLLSFFSVLRNTDGDC